MWTGGCLCSMEDLAERCNFSCFLCEYTHRSSNKAPISVGRACGLHCSIFGGCVKTRPYSLVEVLKDMGLKQWLHSNLNSHPQNRVCQRTWLFCYRATAVVWLLEHWFGHGSTEVGRRGMVQITDFHWRWLLQLVAKHRAMFFENSKSKISCLHQAPWSYTAGRKIANS
jgi:hypothetical protein